MTITIRDIVENIDFFQRLAKQSLPARTAFNLSRILREITNEYNTFQTARKSLFEHYAVRDENNELVIDENGNYTIAQEDIPAVNKEILELLETEVNINCKPIMLSEIADMTFTPGEMYALKNFIEE